MLRYANNYYTADCKYCEVINSKHKINGTLTVNTDIRTDQLAVFEKYLFTLTKSQFT